MISYEFWDTPETEWGMTGSPEEFSILAETIGDEKSEEEGDIWVDVYCAERANTEPKLFEAKVDKVYPAGMLFEKTAKQPVFETPDKAYGIMCSALST